ncbi:unnamed protein product [Haemonchus placei]|uniref:Uncharacterized protein n=1 Tax=Haemonchus placei TaxID=6290 RepID=A0A3P7WP78_HAEPC|nr:unnamed protein product [Haemonchus placei]
MTIIGWCKAAVSTLFRAKADRSMEQFLIHGISCAFSISIFIVRIHFHTIPINDLAVGVRHFVPAVYCRLSVLEFTIDTVSAVEVGDRSSSDKLQGGE